METAQSIIKDSLQEIMVQSSEQPIQNVDFQTGKRYLNRMMATSPFSGMGFTNVTLPTDLITIPDAAIDGVMFNLATKLLSTYDVALTSELALNARNGLKDIRRITVNIAPTDMPCTLPVGSGNESGDTYRNRHFYACPDSKVATEQGGSILLESDT